MSEHLHTDPRQLTIGCPACIDIGRAGRTTPRAEPGELSRGVRLTLRNRALLEAGIHPATRRPLLEADQGRTCGDCAHHVEPWHGAKRYHKCELHRLGTSSSEHSDIRVGWPACLSFATELEQIPTKEKPQ